MSEILTLATALETEHRLLLVLMQLILIIAAARICAAVFRRLGQPAAVGEIAAGLILGPSVLGKLESAGWIPHVSSFIFDARVEPIFQVISQLGLILLLFLIGLEFDFGHLRRRARAAAAISIMGIVTPFVLGAGLAYLIQPHLRENVGTLGFALFMGTAMSITALPILGRMMMELKISRTRVGAITITAAAIDDATGWILLATVSALVQAKFQGLHSLGMISMTVLFALAMIFLVRPAMRWWIARATRDTHGRLNLNQMAILLIVLLLCAVATSLIGIFAIFGAFMLGAILSAEHEFREAVKASLSSFVTAFFLPIFFTYTGLRTDIGRLDSSAMWLMAGGVLLVAVAGKFGGCALSAWMSGFSSRESVCIGVLMNTRALMELIVINVGYDLKVIPQSVFCMLVIMALVTTAMTTPVLLFFMRGTELEEGIRQSPFSRPFRPRLALSTGE